jgi:hypothetical protein
VSTPAHELDDAAPVRVAQALEADAGLGEPLAAARRLARVGPDHPAARLDALPARQLEGELDRLPDGERARQVQAQAARREVDGVLDPESPAAAPKLDRDRNREVAPRLEGLARSIPGGLG